jgi:signal peptidase I
MNILQTLIYRRALKELKSLIKHLRHLIHINDDILADTTKEKIRAIIIEAEDTVFTGDIDAIKEFTKNAHLRAVKIFPRKKHPIIREYVDVFAVALTVAFGLRALFMQPFQIPTSSMQPTLFGIHYITNNPLPNGTKVIPGDSAYLNACLYSVRRADAVVKRSGELGAVSEYNKNLFFTYTKFNIGGIPYTLPGKFNQVFTYCNFYNRLNRDSIINQNIRISSLQDAVPYVEPFKKGETLARGWFSLGDHLFVDRYTFQFRDPRRGDITVFNTEGLSCRKTGYYFIKRLIGMPGDTLKIIDNMVYVKEKGATDFKPITDFNIPAINRIYSGKGGYHGHLAERRLAPGLEFTVPDEHYFMMGDNSARSSDSRYWGSVPRQNIVGRAAFIFWPFSRRWGRTDLEPPVDIKTTVEDALPPPYMHMQPSMSYQ